MVQNRPPLRPSPIHSTSPGGVHEPADLELAKQQLQQLAWLMDESIPIPFLGIRVGVDGLLGLIPGIGDLISAGISSFIIRQASLLGVPKVVLLQMGFNTAIDLVIGAVPLVGDIFDIGWKANKRNVRLALRYLEDPRRAETGSWFTVIGLSLGIGLAVALLIYGFIEFLRWMGQAAA